MRETAQTHPPSGGFTQIDNALIEALFRERLRGEELRVFLVVIRMTSGYHRKRSLLTISYLTKVTGISKRSVERALKGLCEQNMIEKSRTYRGNQFCVMPPSSWAVSAHEQKALTVQKSLLPVGRDAALHGGGTLNKDKNITIKEKLFIERHDVKEQVEILPISQPMKSGSTRSQTLTDLEALKCRHETTPG